MTRFINNAILLIMIMSFIFNSSFSSANQLPYRQPQLITDISTQIVKSIIDPLTGRPAILHGSTTLEYSLCDDMVCSTTTPILSLPIKPPFDFHIRNGNPFFAGTHPTQSSRFQVTSCNNPICSTSTTTDFFYWPGSFSFASISIVSNSINIVSGYVNSIKTGVSDLYYFQCDNFDCTTSTNTQVLSPTAKLPISVALNPLNETLTAAIYSYTDAGTNTFNLQITDSLSTPININNDTGNSPFLIFHPTTNLPWITHYKHPDLFISECESWDCSLKSTYFVKSSPGPPFGRSTLFFEETTNLPIILVPYTNILWMVRCADTLCTSSTTTTISNTYNGGSLLNPAFFTDSLNDTFIIFSELSGNKIFDLEPSSDCLPGQHLDVSIVPPQCVDCPQPPTGNLYNPFYNTNTTCNAIPLQFCPPGYFNNVSLLPFCQMCPAAPLSGSYNPLSTNVISCSLTLEPNCPAGYGVFINGSTPSLTYCDFCGSAISTGSWNPSNNRDACSFVLFELCPSHQYLVLNALEGHCEWCPNSTISGTFNPGPNLNTSCEFFSHTPCPPQTFLYLEGPSATCSNCPKESTLGIFNPEPNLNTTCEFIFNGAKCPAGFVEENSEDSSRKCSKIYIEPEDFTLLYSLVGAMASLLLCTSGILYRLHRTSGLNVAYHKSSMSKSKGTQVDDSTSPNGKNSSKTKYKVNLLSLDGAGSRITTTTTLISILQNNYKIPIYKAFHLIGGVSTGGILALSISRLSEASLYDTESFFKDLASVVFSSYTNFGPMPILKQLFGYHLYSGHSLSSVVKKFFSSSIPLLSTADAFDQQTYPMAFSLATNVSVSPPQEYLFRTYPKPETPHCFDGPDNNNILLWEAARATNAAPFLIPPYSLFDGTLLLQDGSLISPNPSPILLKEAESLWPHYTIGIFVSIGSGAPPLKSKKKSISNVFTWVASLRELSFRIKQIHYDISADFKEFIYFRFNPPLPSHIPIESNKESDQLSCMVAATTYVKQKLTIRKIKLLKERLLYSWPSLNPPLTLPKILESGPRISLTSSNNSSSLHGEGTTTDSVTGSSSGKSSHLSFSSGRSDSISMTRPSYSSRLSRDLQSSGRPGSFKSSQRPSISLSPSPSEQRKLLAKYRNSVFLLQKQIKERQLQINELKIQANEGQPPLSPRNIINNIKNSIFLSINSTRSSNSSGSSASTDSHRGSNRGSLSLKRVGDEDYSDNYSMIHDLTPDDTNTTFSTSNTLSNPDGVTQKSSSHTPHNGVYSHHLQWSLFSENTLTDISYSDTDSSN